MHTLSLVVPQRFPASGTSASGPNIKIIVCGGRTYADRHHVWAALDKVLKKYPDLTVIAGGARGADTLAADWAKDRQVKLTILMADWDTYGRSAGIRRNEAMLKLLRRGRDAVVAFPGGRGTQHMCTIAEQAGVTIWRPPLPTEDL